MKYNIEDKIQFTKPIREHWVLKAKTGQIATIKSIEGDIASVELTNGELVKTTVDKIEPYKKKEKFNIKTISNEELVDRFECLVAHEVQTINTKTKTYGKMLKDIEKMREELLRRLESVKDECED